LGYPRSRRRPTPCGTPVYLAPEIWLRKTYGFEVDWWSLGCVLFEMVSGLPPFWGDTIKDVYKKVINTQPKFPQMTPECQACIEQLLAREPAQRLGSRDNGSDILSHGFFAGMSWEALLAKQVRPPFKSKSNAPDDTQNFHRAFTNQKATDSLTKETALAPEQEAHFAGFTYVPTNQTSPPAPAAQPATPNVEALSLNGGSSGGGSSSADRERKPVPVPLS